MSKTIITAVALLVIIVFSGVSFSQTPDEGPGFAAEDKGIPPEKFDETKAWILKRIEDRMKRLQEEKACVEAAKNPGELKKCRPERPGGQGRWKSQEQQMKKRP